MAGNSSKKERHRLKRKKKKDQRRRHQSISPYLRMGSTGQVEKCLINENWKEDGIASIQILCQVPTGDYALAVFLVDTWCVGLKDAWCRLDVSLGEFHDMMNNHPLEMNLIDVDLEVVRGLVAGGIRFAKQNGFRLPRRYERSLKIIGGVGDIDSADLSDFGKDGKLVWCGPIDDLRKCLIGSTLDEFIARDDVDVIAEFGFNAPSSFDEDDLSSSDVNETMDDIAESVCDQMLNGARQWCFANSESPHPRLEEVVELTIESIMQIPNDDNTFDVDEMNTDYVAEKGISNMQTFLSVESQDDTEDLNLAMDQFKRYMGSFESSEDMIRNTYDSGKPKHIS